jgi:hypothetical protein
VQFPDFFEQVPRLQVQDPLAELLGAADGGRLEYSYADAVKLAGHSCPTVATAYVLGHRALSLLYPGAIPERGGVRVDFADHLDAGVTGVIASILTLLTGAAQSGGFKGISGHFSRRDMQQFAVELPRMLRLTRLDTGAAVDAGADISKVPPEAGLSDLMGRCLSGSADAAERRRFGELWQRRVERLLINHWNDPQVFAVRPASELILGDRS